MKKVLLTEPIRPQGMKLLQKEVELVIAPDRSEETILDLIGEFDGVITRTTKITREMMERSARLKVIGRHGAGLDLVDMDAASEHGICVVHTPGANARSVAEFVVAMMLALSRYLIPADYAQRVERQFKRRDQFLGHDLQNKTLGIIGMGRVGREVAKICRGGFDMRILGFDPWVTKEDLASIGAEKVETVEDILKNSDFVSLNCPLTADNRGLINKDRLALMKPTAYLINCARGPIVDESALVAALKEGQIAGAALDVFEDEPPREDSPIFDLPNVIATPHMAAFAYESIDNMSQVVATELLKILRGERPLYLANAIVWEGGVNRK